MRIFDLYSKVAELPDGEYFFVNKNFFSWKICVIKKDFELSKKYFYQGTEELDFEETSEKYRFFCAMMQSDDWEMLQSKNKNRTHLYEQPQRKHHSISFPHPYEQIDFNNKNYQCYETNHMRQ